MIETALLFGVLLVASVTDLGSRTIPNALAAVGAVAAIFLSIGFGLFNDHGSLWSHTPCETLIGGVTCFALMFTLWLAGGTGGGDVKLAFAIGALLGWRDGVSALAVSHVLAATSFLLAAGLQLVTCRLPLQAGASPRVRLAACLSGLTHDEGPITLPMAPFFTVGSAFTTCYGGLL